MYYYVLGEDVWMSCDLSSIRGYYTQKTLTFTEIDFIDRASMYVHYVLLYLFCVFASILYGNANVLNLIL